MKTLSFLLLVSLAACSSTPIGDEDPPQAGRTISKKIMAGETKDAGKLFDAYADDDHFRQALYPVLFGIAEERYDSGKTKDSVAVARFVAKKYPKSLSAQEGLLYALFAARNDAGSADIEQLDEMAPLVQKLSGEAGHDLWVDLVATQYWIDRNRPAQAEQTLRSFKERWNGRPSDLSDYILELDRWIQTHP